MPTRSDWTPNDLERTRQIKWTKAGVLLLLVATAIGWIPYLGGLFLVLFAGVLAIVLTSVVLIVVGRKAFGADHQRNVAISVILLVSATILAILGGIFGIASAFPPSTARLWAAISNLLIVTLIASVIGGLPSVLLTFALENPMGKVLLLAGYGVSVVILLVLFADAINGIEGFIPFECRNSVSCGRTATVGALTQFQNRILGWGLASVLPSVLYVGAYKVAWSRIARGEIPRPLNPPASMTRPATVPTRPR